MADEHLIDMENGMSPGETTLLLVDDDEGVRHVLERMVSSLGFRTLSAGDAEEALAVSASETIGLLVCDIALPRLNGYELARRLLSDSPGMPVLFISGYSQEAIRDRYGLVEDAPHLAKPFTFRALASTIRDLIGAKALAA